MTEEPFLKIPRDGCGNAARWGCRLDIGWSIKRACESKVLVFNSSQISEDELQYHYGYDNSQ